MKRWECTSVVIASYIFPVMSQVRTRDINVAQTQPLPQPSTLLNEIPKTEAASTFIASSREEIHRIIFGDDKRLLVVVGPCSIHDVEAGKEYAQRLANLSEELSDRLQLVMRVYFEKPRTTVGWKGLIMDPQLDGSYNIPVGLRMARDFLSDVINMGLPTATELLDPITPQYIADLICWTAIGARTTESQTHRQMASGLSMPLGFKNGTDGSIRVAINAIKAASVKQTFLGIDEHGHASAVTTRGNPNCHIVLRGGADGTNFDAKSVMQTRLALESAALIPAIMVDCSHENSAKDPSKQPEVLADIMRQIERGDESIIGVMLESNLHVGNQKLGPSREKLQYGVSITDGCIDWDTTETILRDAYDSMASRFGNKA